MAVVTSMFAQDAGLVGVMVNLVTLTVTGELLPVGNCSVTTWSPGM